MSDFTEVGRYEFRTSATFYFSEKRNKYKVSVWVQLHKDDNKKFYTGAGRTKLSAYKSAMRKVLIMLEGYDRIRNL